MLDVVFNTIWLMLPAYISNSSAVILGGKFPVDFRRDFLDGKRVLGDGKTYSGLIGGTLAGFTAGMLLNIFSLRFPVSVLFGLSFGAMVGDMVASFIKRRLGLERGETLPLVDQLDFLGGAWMVTLGVGYEWFCVNFTVPIMITALVITPILHVAMNKLGSVLGIS